MSTTSQTQLVVDRSNANELLKINFNVRSDMNNDVQKAAAAHA